MITLVLEASTYGGSVALLKGAVLVGERAVAMRGREHEALMAAVGDLLAEHDVAPGTIARVVCGSGPGSFTSLRIAAAIAKGMAVASGAALVPISSLALLVASRQPRDAGEFLAVADAMRGESYVQRYGVDELGIMTVLGPLGIVSSSQCELLAGTTGTTAIGAGMSGARAVVPRAGAATFITNMIDAIISVDIGSWEPGYGRLAEAQVVWEATHGRPLGSG